MISIYFKGKVISTNRRLEPGRGRWVGGKRYEVFVSTLAWEIRRQRPRGSRWPYPEIDLGISFRVHPFLDHHNLTKPICDAIEQAGVVANDRDIGTVILFKPTRHKPQDPDELWIHIFTGGTE